MGGKKRGERRKERERERRGSEKERDRWGSEWVRERGRLKRERERERDEESMRIREGRKSLGKTDVPKTHAYNECEHPVIQLGVLWKEKVI